jgi:hypothetical protein
MISGMRVPPGLTVILREDPNYTGRSLTITGPAEYKCLTDWSFDDIASSMRVCECYSLDQWCKRCLL